jgi:hypothetical protein
MERISPRMDNLPYGTAFRVYVQTGSFSAPNGEFLEFFIYYAGSVDGHNMPSGFHLQANTTYYLDFTVAASAYVAMRLRHRIIYGVSSGTSYTDLKQIWLEYR